MVLRILRYTTVSCNLLQFGTKLFSKRLLNVKPVFPMGMYLYEMCMYLTEKW